MEKIWSKEIPRRILLQGAGLAAVNLVLNPIISRVAKAASLFDLPPKQIINITNLDDYLRQIQPVKDLLRPIIEANDIFAGFKYLSTQRRLEDFDMYYPLYMAGEMQYQIPWYLLWIIHTHETTISTEKFPEKNGYRGGMQRRPGSGFYSDQGVAEAASGWEFLAEIPARYSKRSGSATDDYSEILWAAQKIQIDAYRIQKTNPSLSFEDCFTKAQYSYCASWAADMRIKRYYILKELFAPVYERPIIPAITRRGLFHITQSL